MRARLDELAGDPADLQHRQRGAVGQHGRHLQQDLQPLADRDGRVGGAGLGQPRRSRGTTRRSRRPGAGTRGRPRPRRAPPAPGAPRRRRRAAAARAGGARTSLGARGVRPLRLLERLEVPPGRRGPGGIDDRHRSKCRGGRLSSESRCAIFSGIQPTGAQALRQLLGRLPPVRRDAGAARASALLLHRRPALDHGRLRPGRPARAHARPGGAALRDRPRPGALDGLRPEPRDRARRGGVAARRR